MASTQSVLLRPSTASLAVPVAAAPSANNALAVPMLAARGLGKSYGNRPVLGSIDLHIDPGEFVTVLGYSGTGKTTLVNLLGGLVPADVGEVLWEGAPISGPSPERAMMFQNYSLLPWRTVLENVALAVDAVNPRMAAGERLARAEHYVALVGLGPARSKRPAELSGGMRQRVALARALAMQPRMLILDEPLSALDALTRTNLQEELAQLCAGSGTTVVMVTNDVDEAILLSDRVYPLCPGRPATLGEAFTIDLPRPRDRRALNRDSRFVGLRKAITQQLLDLGQQRAGGSSEAPRLPDVRPTTARVHAAPGAVHGEPAAEAHVPRFVELSQVTKVYGSTRVVDGFELNIARREFVSIIGHSGCGKSTVLSMLAGLLEISEGVITLDGRELEPAGPDRGMVFQAPSLVPWLTAADNVRLGVESVYGHASKAQREAIVAHYLHRVGLGDAQGRRAADMSNGMRQRVGIARAFALAPKLLLLDEPFGMLDSLTRWELQTVLMEVWERAQLTAVLVTHDVDEALLTSDRVVMMTGGPNAKVGRILQVELPRPRTRATLLDHPDYYRLRGEIIEFLGGAH